jgi:hypothetical protein
LVDGVPEHANSGRIQRGSLPALWEWISRELLPTMARDYAKDMDELITADNPRQARQLAATFQTKVVKCLEGVLRSPEGPDQVRAKLAIYTASPAVYDDLTKMLCALRASDALAKFSDALPAKIANFDDAEVGKISELLAAFAKTDADALGFAMALVAGRLKTPWQLMRLATKAAPSKTAIDVAATPYALAVSMVLDRLDDKRAALGIAMKNNRVLVARELLTEIYDTEYAMRVRIDRLEESDWGQRLDRLMNSIATQVEAEVSRFPDNVRHVFGSRSLRSHQSLAGRLTHMVWKGRDAISNWVGHCRRLIGWQQKFGV